MDQSPAVSENAPGLKDSIRTCLEAARRCLLARQSCVSRGDRLAEPLLLALLLDCAEACELASRWMQRDSAFHPDLCALCATICKSCEAACRQHPGEQALQDCADACRRCFDTCLRMGQKEPLLTH